MKQKELIDDILLNGKVQSWLEYAKQYSIKPESTDAVRSKAANDVWRSYLRKEASNMVLTKKTKKGKKGYKTYKNLPIQPAVDLSEFEIAKIWETPEGRIGKSYYKKEIYGVTSEEFERIQLDLQCNIPISIGNGVGTVYVSDLHAGAFVKKGKDTVHSENYSLEVLQKYLQSIVNKINSRRYSKVNIVIPGDLIESFSAFNHPDTWKSVQAYGGEIVIAIYELIKKFIQAIANFQAIYLIEGNHDRITSFKESNYRKGIVEVVAHFLKEAGVTTYYHPYMLREEIDGILHIIMHGDYRTYKDYDTFLFKNGKQGIFNLLMTGHLHNFNIVKTDLNFMHVQCPSIFTGSFYSEVYGANTLPAFIIVENESGKPKIEYIPI